MFGGLSWATGPSAASAATATTTFNASIVQGSDDSEEAVASGSIVSGSDDLELSYDSGAANSGMLTGLRFQGVTIPQGANILSAYIQFTVKDAASSVGNPTIDIHGQDADSAGTFTTTSSDISSRPLTTATVAWNPPSWNHDGEAGAAQRTPDLASIVQEIVNRDGWAGGNGMAFVLSSQNSDANNRRIAAASEHNTFAAPSLEIVFEGEHAGGGGGVRTILLPSENDWTDHGVAVAATGNIGDWNYQYRGGDFSQPVEKDGTLYCYVIGADGERSGDGGPRRRRLGLITSTDGENWSVHPDSPLVEFFPEGDGGSNNEEEGVLTAACAIDDAGDFYLSWGGMTANAPTQVLVEHFLSVSSDGVNFSDNDAASANKIIASDDGSFAGQVSNPDAAEDESWAVDIHWDEQNQEFQYYYTVKSNPVRAQYHVAGADLNNLDGADSSMVIDKPSGGRWFMGHLVDRGNDNFDYFVSGADDYTGQIRRIPMNGRDFKDFGSHTLFYEFPSGDGFVKSTVYPSRALGKWIMLYLVDSSEIRVKTAPLVFESEPDPEPVQTIALPNEGDWTDHGDVVADGGSGDWDDRLNGAISPCALIEHDGTFYLYYIGADGGRDVPPGDDDGPRHRALGLATSTDGENWTKHTSSPLIFFQPDGLGDGTNTQEEGVFGAGCAVTPDGTFHLAWGGLSAVSSTQVEINHYYSVSSDGVDFSDDGPGFGDVNKIIDNQDSDFAGLVTSPDGAEDETWPLCVFWNDAAGQFEYYYTSKLAPYHIYHVAGSDLSSLDGNESSTAVDDEPESGDVWRGVVSLVDRGNDNLDLYATVEASGDDRGVIYRFPITGRDFSNPGSPQSFLDFGTSGKVKAVVCASRTREKWVMIYREDTGNDVHLRVKTAPLQFEGDGGSGETEQTFNTSISQSSDDAEEVIATGATDELDSTDLEMVYENPDGQQLVGLRFEGVTIPQGAEIVSAHIQFAVEDPAESAGSPTLTIHGQAADNAGTFTNADGNITARPTTTASVDWSPPAWNTADEQGPAQRTSDITAVVQEIINRPGWSSGNAIACLISGPDDPNARRTAHSFDGNAALAPSIEIVYLDDGEGSREGRGGGGDGSVPASAQWYIAGSDLSNQEISDYNDAVDQNISELPKEFRYRISDNHDFRVRSTPSTYPPKILETDQSADLLRGDVYCRYDSSHTDRHTMWEVYELENGAPFSTIDINRMSMHQLYRFGCQFYIPSGDTAEGHMVFQTLAGSSGVGGPYNAVSIDADNSPDEVRFRFQGSPDGQPDAGGNWPHRIDGTAPYQRDTWHTIELEFIIDPEGNTDGYAKFSLDGEVLLDSSVDPGEPISVGPGEVSNYPTPFTGQYFTGDDPGTPVETYLRNIWFEEVT